jgi:uncharacterized protein YbjT (DUF2867 family)
MAVATAAVEVVMAEAADVPAVGRVVMVAGATGLVGREVLAALLADRDNREIHLLGRSAPALQDPRIRMHTVDFLHLPALPAVEEVYIALGTTIGAAGSRAAFRAVDHDAVVAVASAAHASGAQRLGVVSAMGADASSRVFYSRTKGEMERSLAAIGYPALVVARPSLLAGDRASLGQPRRPGERIGLQVSRVVQGLIPANYRPIHARRVAECLIQSVRAAVPGQKILLSGAMQ